MRDDGDRITLDDSIGQRLTKVIKRADAGGEYERSIAKKIFETVDRKAAEPKTRHETQKGVARARQLLAESLTLTPEERRILKSPHEILLIHFPDGKLKSVTLGNRGEVEIPSGIPYGAILSHQHPSGRGPSASDLKYVLLNPGTTLRVVALNENGRIEIFELRASDGISEEDVLAFTELYRTECEEGGDSHAARRVSLALILSEIGHILQVVSATVS